LPQGNELLSEKSRNHLISFFRQDDNCPWFWQKNRFNFCHCDNLNLLLAFKIVEISSKIEYWPGTMVATHTSKDIIHQPSFFTEFQSFLKENSIWQEK
jgi:hypothetical protein